MIPVYFEKEKHIYYADANKTIEVPSLSHVLKSIGIDNLEGIPKHLLDYGLKRGSAVHLALELLDKDNLADASIWKPYVDSWIEAKGLLGIKSFQIIEKPVRSEKYNFACTPDRLFDDTIVEIKTGGDSVKYPLQTAGQAVILKENGFEVKKRIAVHFDNKGKYKIIKHDNEQDFYDFIKCVEFFHVKSRRLK